MPDNGKRYKFNRMKGAQISEELRVVGLTLGQVSVETGVNPATLQKWIDGRDEPSQLFASWLALRAMLGAAAVSKARSDEYRIIED